MTEPHVTSHSVTFAGGIIRFDLPDWAAYVGGRPTRCRSCQAAVLFVRSMRTGKLAPIDPDGTSHFATCPEAAAWRRAPGKAGVTRAPADADGGQGLVTLPRPSGAGGR